MANNGFFKKVYVLITTHNRTNVACACIESLVKNLKYGNLGWIVSDDRSEPGHVEALVSKFNSLGISEVAVCRTDSKRFGLGASMNNGLKVAFRGAEVVLTTEDDWFLQKELRLEPYVRLFDIDQNIGCIRFGPMMYAKLTRHHRYKIFDKVYSDGGLYTSVFNNQVALRHRRIYQRLGAYKENCPCDVSEQDMIARYNCGCGLDVLYPNFMKTGTMDDPSLFFIHVGKSTIGHNKYVVPDRFNWIYDEEKMPIATQTINNNTVQSGIQDARQRCGVGKIVVTMTSWTKRIRNCLHVLTSIVSNTMKPDIVFLNLAVCEFPNKENELPWDLVNFVHDNDCVYINWVDGENTKSMKKVYPILDLIDDDDMIIICDDDLDIPQNFIQLRVQEFMEHNGMFPISGGTNPRYHLNLPLYNTRYNSLTASSIFTKKMLAGYDKIWTKKVIETYKDDTIHTLLCLSNGYHPIPSKYLSTWSGVTKNRIPFYNDTHGMKENHVWKSDEATIRAFCEEYDKNSIHSFHESLFNLVIWDSFDVAGDNGECMYRKIGEQYPHVKMTFIISKNSKDWKRLEGDGFNLYPFEGIDVGTILDNASFIVWSKDIPTFGTTNIMSMLRSNRDKSVFVSHGITSRIYDCSFYFKYISMYAKYSCCVSDDEACVVRKYSKENIFPIVSGFPRHDIILRKLHALQKNSKQKQILISFHKRPGLQRLSETEFEKTDYCREINKFLASTELFNLTAHGIKIVFITHAIFKKYKKCFVVPQYIEFANCIPFQDVFVESDLLITDFSSTSFEFALMNKPTIAFIPDMNSVKSKYTQYKIDEIRNYDHICLCETMADVQIDAERLLKQDTVDYRRNVIKYSDQNNTTRLFNALFDDFMNNESVGQFYGKQSS